MRTAPLRVLLVSSSGGVLLDLLGLRPWWSQQSVHWAVVRAPDTEAAVRGAARTWVREFSLRRPFGLVLGLRRAAAIMRSPRPDVVVSAGTGAAVPFFLVARAMGIPAFWVSTLNLVETPGIAARICARLASGVLLQRESMRAAHPDGILIGELY